METSTEIGCRALAQRRRREHGESRKAMETVLIGPPRCANGIFVVNADNAERQWRPGTTPNSLPAAGLSGERGERRKAEDDSPAPIRYVFSLSSAGAPGWGNGFQCFGAVRISEAWCGHNGTIRA